jgi:hypothetical protein
MQSGSQGVIQPAEPLSPSRRTTAAALKQQILGFLAKALPAGWTVQPLQREQEASADILILSPRGRCHFLFVHAPADRWWDGGPHSVAAERFSAAEARLARRLRAAGHRARAIWTAKDLVRALQSWGCPLTEPVRFGAAAESAAPLPRARLSRPTLHLADWGRPDHG